MKASDHRNSRRVPIEVLVKCLPPGVAPVRNGHIPKGWEMLARNIAHDGVGLRWSRRWAEANCPHCLQGLSNLFPEREICLCTPPNKVLQNGQDVLLDGLVYTEKGSVPLRGRVRWVRSDKKGNTYDVGIHVTSPDHRTHFKALEQ